LTCCFLGHPVYSPRRPLYCVGGMVAQSVMSRPPQTQPVITWNPGVRNDKMFKVLSDSLSVVATGNPTRRHVVFLRDFV